MFLQVDVSRGSCGTCHVEPLGLDQVLWANTVVASGTVIGIAIYTGRVRLASPAAVAAVSSCCGWLRHVVASHVL